MTRLETINKLKTAEERVQDLKALLDDVSDFYCKDVSITVQLNTTRYPYHLKYDGSPIDVNKVALIGFVKLEIDGLERQITEMIGELIR